MTKNICNLKELTLLIVQMALVNHCELQQNGDKSKIKNNFGALKFLWHLFIIYLLLLGGQIDKGRKTEGRINRDCLLMSWLL